MLVLLTYFFQEYCFETGLADNGCSNTQDLACHCGRSSIIISEMTPCLRNLCSTVEVTLAVAWWQAFCVLAISSAVPVPGFATDSMGFILASQTAPVTGVTRNSLPVSTPTIPTSFPEVESLFSEFSFRTQTGLPTNLISEIDTISSPTGSSFRSGESDAPSSSSSSLSTGAKAGIAGAVVGVALLAGLGVWLFCRRRRRAKPVTPETYMGGNEAFSEKMPVVSTTQQVEQPKHPSNSIQRKPVQQNHVYPELDGRSPVSPATLQQPSVPHSNELEGQYWPATHERRGELAG